MRNKENKHLGIEVNPELHRKLHGFLKDRDKGKGQFYIMN